jgi:hypothetical protein
MVGLSTARSILIRRSEGCNQAIAKRVGMIRKGWFEKHIPQGLKALKRGRGGTAEALRFQDRILTQVL